MISMSGTCAQRGVAGSADNTTERSNLAALTFDVGAGEVRNKNILYVSADCIDEDLPDKEVSVLPLDPRK